MTDDQLLQLAKLNGWTIISTLVQLDHFPQHGKGDTRMWRNPSGVTVCELVYEGAAGRYVDHRYYKTVDEAIIAEGGTPAPVDDDEIIEEQSPLPGILDDL